MTDPSSGGPITSLQDFLYAEGYLAATPNGHFGPSTLTAVTSFQSAHGLSPVGSVGPLTRAVIAGISCGGTSLPSTNTISSTILPSTPVSNVTAPLASTTLTIGKNYTITWNGMDNTGYDIVLEDQNGLSQGFITPNMQTSGTYVWQVGQVLSGVTGSYAVVPPGTYQIDLTSVSGGAPDIVSGKFTITAPPIAITSIEPSTASLSAATTLVIFGSGLGPSATIAIDGYYNLAASVLYASADGTVLVFSLPANVAIGQHEAYVSTPYSMVVSSPFTVAQ